MPPETVRHPVHPPRQPPPLTWHMECGPDARCVAVVRAGVERAMTAWGCAEDDTAAAVLICSELTTNAVRYAGVPGGQFCVRVCVTGSGCLIEVSDGAAAFPRPACPDADDERGRGLLLVTALTDSFGCRRLPQGGKTVWARLTLSTPPDDGTGGGG
jgi:anti-sigma regulatory factor (Ser/Thr protein kinase)